MNARRIEHGDWQTPLVLARRVVALLDAECGGASIVEPTCGRGSFLHAAKERFPNAALHGWEIEPSYAESARTSGARVTVADFFRVDWKHALAALAEPLLVLGNPPWVTNATLGALGSTNLPAKTNLGKLSGIDALTGKSNFDISEFMILRLIEALEGKDATLAFVCKSTVARRVIERTRIAAELRRIDAMEHFDASVDAVVFVARIGRTESRWPVYASIEARRPESTLGLENGVLVADADRFARTQRFSGVCDPEWRSGLKHDCARVMELVPDGRSWKNGAGERVGIEDEHVFPLLKSSDVVHGRSPRRAVLVTQRALGEDTSKLPTRTLAYLARNAKALAARKSSIYEGQPPYAIFGIGSYAFAPWKVAIAGLYKRFVPMLVGPSAVDGKPIMLDDTCYFLPFDREDEARTAFDALRSPFAMDFFAARIFWDAKRPIRKSILQSLDLRALMRECSKA